MESLKRQGKELCKAGILTCSKIPYHHCVVAASELDPNCLDLSHCTDIVMGRTKPRILQCLLSCLVSWTSSSYCQIGPPDGQEGERPPLLHPSVPSMPFHSVIDFIQSHPEGPFCRFILHPLGPLRCSIYMPSLVIPPFQHYPRIHSSTDTYTPPYPRHLADSSIASILRRPALPPFSLISFIHYNRFIQQEQRY